MFDFSGVNAAELNFDMDGDGIPDSYAEPVDLDGDGVADSFMLDMDHDGIADVVAVDLDGNGEPDSYITAEDWNDDGLPDTYAESQDMDGDGIYDTFLVGHDMNGDGVYESGTLGVDNDGDGVIDSFINMADENGDGIFDAISVHDVAAGTTEVILDNIDFDNDVQTELLTDDMDDFDNFDPSHADMDKVSGNPAEAMEEWEYQGDTSRCAIYSQKFIIDEFTGEDHDIEELADLAEENGWFTEENGTPMNEIDNILEHYNIDSEMSFNNDISDLKECLDNGGRVIVSLDADEIWYGETDDIFTPGEGANHAVEVIGIDYSDPDDPMVILNDSGHPDGCGSMIPMDDFVDAWEDGNCQMIECYE